MGLLDSIRSMFGGGASNDVADTEKFECRHETLTPHWDNAADEGDESKATGFVCASCESDFTPQQADWARKRGLEPCWDTAVPASYALAEKLGYVPAEEHAWLNVW